MNSGYGKVDHRTFALSEMGARGRGEGSGLIYVFLVFYKFIYLFIFGCIGSSLLHAGFFLVAASRGYSSLQCAGFSLRWLLLLRSTGSRRVGFSSCGSWAQ